MPPSTRAIEQMRKEPGMPIEFTASDELGDLGKIVVSRDGRRLGGIYHAGGVYRFHVGDHEKLGTPEMADNDLEALKAKIRSRYET